MNYKKCIVHKCTNCSDQGSFVGDICSPCYQHITTGKIGPTTSFLGDLVPKEDISQNSMKIPTWEELFFKHVYLISRKSKDKFTKIGAVLVDNRTIISEGFNGFAKGVNDDVFSRHERPEKYFYMSHSERNCIFHCARRGIKTENAVMFTQSLPCCDCADAIINSGIKEVVIHKEWQDIWNTITQSKWIESSERSKIKFSESGVKIRIFSGFLNEKTMISGKYFIL